MAPSQLFASAKIVRTDEVVATLLIVGQNDPVVTDLNRQVLGLLNYEKALAIVPGASHLFEEEGALEQAAALASSWFKKFLSRHE